jgi:hypothetical protein
MLSAKFKRQEEGKCKTDRKDRAVKEQLNFYYIVVESRGKYLYQNHDIAERI